MRAVCLHCFKMSLVWDEGPIEYMFGDEDRQKVDNWIGAHKKDCEGQIVLDFPEAKTVLE